MADCHFRVNKQTIEARDGQQEDAAHNQPSERTVVRVATLNSQLERREELAQLASGRSETEAIAFAESLLVQAASLRQTARRTPNSEPVLDN